MRTKIAFIWVINKLKPGWNWERADRARPLPVWRHHFQGKSHQHEPRKTAEAREQS